MVRLLLLVTWNRRPLSLSSILHLNIHNKILMLFISILSVFALIRCYSLSVQLHLKKAKTFHHCRSILKKYPHSEFWLYQMDTQLSLYDVNSYIHYVLLGGELYTSWWSLLDIRWHKHDKLNWVSFWLIHIHDCYGIA